MSVRTLEFIRNSGITEIGVKAAVGAGVMIGACLGGDWLGVRIFRLTHCTLMSITPKFISNGVHQIFSRSLAPINQYFEQKSPFLGRAVVAPILEELVFRGAQVLILPRVLGLINRIALSSIVFNYAHNVARPGTNLALLFIGIILGALAEWNESAVRGLLTAILAHSIYNAVIDRFYVQILRIGIK